MSREKQIEKMAKDMCEYYYEGTCYQDKKPCDCKCDIFTDAQYLYVKGYRKASEVAREIFEDIQKIIVHRVLHNENYSFEGVMDSITNDLDELKKKYTEEGK